MTLAIVTHTPEPVVWSYTLGGLARRIALLPKMLPLINPLASGEGGEDSSASAGRGPSKISTPAEIGAFCSRFGIDREEVAP